MKVLKELIKKFEVVLGLLFIGAVVAGLMYADYTYTLAPTDSSLPTPVAEESVLDDYERLTANDLNEGMPHRYIVEIAKEWAAEHFTESEFTAAFQYRDCFLVSATGHSEHSGENETWVLVFIYEGRFTQQWALAGDYRQPELPTSTEPLRAGIQTRMTNLFGKTGDPQILLGPDGNWFMSIVGAPKKPVDGSEWEQWVIVFTSDGRLVDEWLLKTEKEHVAQGDL